MSGGLAIVPDANRTAARLQAAAPAASGRHAMPVAVPPAVSVAVEAVGGE